MKKPLAAIALLCVVAGIAWYFNTFRQRPAPPPATPPVATNSPAATAPPPIPATNATAAALPAATEPTTNLPAADDPIVVPGGKPTLAAQAPNTPLTDGLVPFAVLENMRGAFRDYAGRFGANPVGTNPEITKTLTGDNPKGVNFIRPETGLHLNSKGELIDPWGTPWFFHQLSARQMEIRSAGPDKKMWTADDLLAR